MYLDTFSKNECSGCGSCMSVCSCRAITMESDEMGFHYPTIDSSLCVHCNLCKTACGFINTKERENSGKVRCFGFRHTDRAVLKASRSGGAFYAIAEEVIRSGGIVWGAALCEEMVVRHIWIDTLDNLCKLQGSKYVQSDMEDSYPVVASQLTAGNEVLFSGTACQIAGLNAFLTVKRIDCSKLLTCDIVCQGVPSPKLFSEHLEYLRKKHGSEISDFNFRDASRIGWEGHEESYIVNNERRFFSREYTTMHIKCLRESCFSCPFASLSRPADITLADFWGVKEHYPNFYSDLGNSMVMINTENGMCAFNKAKQETEVIEVDIERALQPRLCSPSQKPEDYDEFWKQYIEKGYLYCIKTYGRESFKSKLVYTVKPLLRRLNNYRMEKR